MLWRPFLGVSRIFKMNVNTTRKSGRPKPPEKGSFPLDHDGECKTRMTEYMECLKQNGYDQYHCRDYAQRYLQCRMDKELMSKEEWKKLGFSKPPSPDTPTDQ